MNSVLERLKEKKVEIKEKESTTIFVKIEEVNKKKTYHTKIMKDLYIFGASNNQKHRFFISFRELFNQQKIKSFYLFSLKGNDRFLGIYYGYRKPIKNVVTRYEENGIMKASTFSRVYYIEFRFKKGSIFCYIVGISYLLKKEKVNTRYYESLIERILNLEKQVYEFYNKELSNGGIIIKWIKKRQK
ncbi:DUF226 domain-containing protein [Borrelia miyamotoi]|uniref:DUF226 domain-containing protein n=1 Tax=Borrelia miyamotoi TaxID=47466 RepID=A0AAQ3AHR5_9SPIR|nr:DUF226 domain-containing protein [Borrelia miyamotoi]AOW96260.1 hypothetical protein AXH25_04875 [Borrelia miyamotoi]QTL84348.1 DUF226 domain-containing protein [Borrelia miyamotoi]WAZ86020.1 DUF226 domain-containing protein [Borrelia miyamotoi]WAZ91803.1 DUF226 domain-containing protein [Borrelia miyamotoi]WAZ93096.1 DUF226 domain-containing protein [Borrelia miyamotoi]